MEWVVGLLVFLALALAGLGAWAVGRRAFQLCPHCAWIVRRVRSGWLRCPRCHKQYGRPHKVRP
jgi:hypothetical protein